MVLKYDEEGRVILSKSGINGYLQCPYSFYLSAIKGEKGLPNKYFERGTAVHDAIKYYYSDGTIYTGEHFEMFENFLEFDKKAGKPKYSEKLFESKKYALKGFIDVFFGEDKILFDFKTSKFDPKNINDYRLELAVYKLIMEDNGEEVKKSGIVFLGSGDVWYEEAKDMKDEVLKKAEEVRKGIKEEKFEPKENKYCGLCGYREMCPLMKKKVLGLWGV